MTAWPVALREGAVWLRPIRARDQKQWDQVRARNRDWLAEWEATLPPGGRPGPASFRDFVRMMTRQARRGEALPWLVWVDPNAEGDWRVAGQLTVSPIHYGSANSATLGYWIDQDFAGRGIIPTAVALATDFCFAELGLHRIEIAIRPENDKSLRVVEKLGFRHEGRRRAFLHINGAWRDHEIFAMLAEEAPAGGLVARWRQSHRAG